MQFLAQGKNTSIVAKINEGKNWFEQIILSKQTFSAGKTYLEDISYRENDKLD